MPAEIGYNVYANTSLTGYNDGSPEGYGDESFDYTKSFTVAPGAFNLINQLIQISTDADFVWRAFSFPPPSSATFRFATSQGFYLSNSPILASNLGGGGLLPIFPEIIFPAGGAIRIDIGDPSGLGLTVQPIFRGVKRYAKVR